MHAINFVVQIIALLLNLTIFQLRVALGKQGDQNAVNLNRIMDRADVNGDGEISYDEYNRLMNMDKFGDSEVG